MTRFRGRAAAPSTGFTAPAYAGDFPDPAVAKVGLRYHAYGTGSGGRNLSAMASTDLSRWGEVTDPLPSLPSWAAPGHTWAPSVVREGSGFVLYYTVREAASGRQCISLASSPTPEGPFVDASAGPLIAQADHGGSIDPHAYVDPATGDRALLWKSDDNAIGRPTHLWGQRLAADGRSLVGLPALLLSQREAWQAPRVERPALVVHAGTYYLFYGANDYTKARSGIGYATSPSVLGSYANKSMSAPWLGSRGQAQGPQAPAPFTDRAGHQRMAFAAWHGPVGYEHGGARSVWIATLGFSPGGEATLQVP